LGATLALVITSWIILSILDGNETFKARKITIEEE
jgi:hypothetical protein